MAVATGQINAAWRKAGRGGNANKTLTLMVQSRRLKRTPLGGRMGSEYSLGSGRLPARAAAKHATARAAAKKTQKRGEYKLTAEEFVLSLLKGRRVLSTRQLAAAWKKAGRGGIPADTLSKMTKARKLKRTPLGGRMGSEYRAG